MKAIISDKDGAISVLVQSIKVNTSVDLHFASTTESQEAFKKLRSAGIKCYHVGENCPGGPYIACYKFENITKTFLFQQS